MDYMDKVPDLSKTPTAKPEHKKEIPFSLFYGIGKEEFGIFTVSFSPEFYRLKERGEIEQMGFSMEELEAKKKELEEKYKGQTQAPFEFRLG